MPDDNDRHWLDALAGKPAAADAELAAVKEGAVVRQAMMASQRPLPRLDVEAGARRLLGRLREEKLLEEPGLRRFGWKFPVIAFGAALAIALGIAMREQPSPVPAKPEIPEMKGDPGGSQEIVTVDAREIAPEIQANMMQAGLAPSVTERGALTRLEADWPRAPSAQQLDFLRDYGLARPNGPKLRIDVRPPQQE